MLLFFESQRKVHVHSRLFGLSYPDAEERADRLVVTGLQLHVAAVVQLLDVEAAPQHPVAPGRDTALTAAGVGGEHKKGV